LGLTRQHFIKTPVLSWGFTSENAGGQDQSSQDIALKMTKLNDLKTLLYNYSYVTGFFYNFLSMFSPTTLYTLLCHCPY